MVFIKHTHTHTHTHMIPEGSDIIAKTLGYELH